MCLRRFYPFTKKMAFLKFIVVPMSLTRIQKVFFKNEKRRQENLSNKFRISISSQFFPNCFSSTLALNGGSSSSSLSCSEQLSV